MHELVRPVAWFVGMGTELGVGTGSDVVGCIIGSGSVSGSLGTASVARGVLRSTAEDWRTFRVCRCGSASDDAEVVSCRLHLFFF